MCLDHVTRPLSLTLSHDLPLPSEPVDMFADIQEPSTGTASSSSGGMAPVGVASDEVCWEYKWKDEESEKIHGPFTSTQMAEWQGQGSVGSCRHLVMELAVFTGL